MIPECHGSYDIISLNRYEVPSSIVSMFNCKNDTHKLNIKRVLCIKDTRKTTNTITRSRYENTTIWSMPKLAKWIAIGVTFDLRGIIRALYHFLNSMSLGRMSSNFEGLKNNEVFPGRTNGELGCNVCQRHWCNNVSDCW